MNTAGGDRQFAGSIPELYERHLVPLIFEPYARDIAARAKAQTPSPSRVLEIAAGTGVVTRELAKIFPPETSIVATDLNQPMLGFTAQPAFVTVTERSRADSPGIPAIAFCQGTPVRNEIESRGPGRLGEVTRAAEEAIARRFGAGAIEGKIQAHIVAVQRDRP